MPKSNTAYVTAVYRA